VQEAACPFGSYDRRVLGSLRNLGYERIFTSDEGPALAEALIQPRNTIVRAHDLAHIQNIISRPPAGFKKAFRGLKLKVKQLL
jgi:hypothetical protein